MIIQTHILQKALDAALSTGADFADIFVEDTYSSNLSVLNSRPDKAIVGQLYGAGIRVVFGTEVVYVTTSDLSEKGLVKAALIAAQSQTGGASKIIKPIHLNNPNQFDSIHTFGDKPWEINRDKKMAWLNSADQHARSLSTHVTQVEAALNEKFQKVQIVNSRGVSVYDERAYSRFNVETFVETNGTKESSAENHGHMGTSEIFDRYDIKAMTKDTVDRALILTKSGFAPAGEMPVVLANAFGGVILHEACGHGLETTSVQTGDSVFADKMGQKIGNDCLTAIDDGTIANEWGSLSFDDEGMPTKKTTLIENGVVKSFLVDQVGAMKTGFEATGSGRKQSYKFAPASRMRNTFIAPGKDKFEDMIKDVDYGLFAKRMGGGSVNTSTGDYNFQVREAYIIRNGRIEEPVKGACLIGRGIDTLGKITKVASDLKMATGMCGSVSGSIPAGVGQPEVLVSSLMVGGKAK
ncbi:TldD/PmbA family protein [Pseudobdellovibrio sp. HCB154]|uniref:TldD/PmbA family protein n=1 Tax=Pseudobdellovibrio sp. HCB154 TaxID=3386277 RepID=UPI0039171518